MGRVQKINDYLFIILFLTLIITFFTRNNIRNVEEIADEAINQPVQILLPGSRVRPEKMMALGHMKLSMSRI